MEIPSFNALIEQSIITNWDKDALTDFKGATLQYHDVARKIEKLHIMFESSGVVKGDKIALCGRNSSNWAVAFLATLTYGAVAVPILHEFTADQIHNIVNHSEAKLLFVGDYVATVIDQTKMPDLEGIIYIPDYSLVAYRQTHLCTRTPQRDVRKEISQVFPQGARTLLQGAEPGRDGSHQLHQWNHRLLKGRYDSRPSHVEQLRFRYLGIRQYYQEGRQHHQHPAYGSHVRHGV